MKSVSISCLCRFAVSAAASILVAVAAGAASRPDSHLFNSGWRFSLDNPAGAESRTFDDSSWRTLDLPHDWAIEGDFSESNPSGTGGGALPGGTGWYRKHFVTPELARGERLSLDFDGAYMNASVYINGHLLGTRPYGYASFSYDITPWLDPNGDNVVAVKVDNAEQPNSRWYSGCGIYRNVRLRSSGPLEIPLWGQKVVPGNISAASATLDITTDVRNNLKGKKKAALEILVRDPDGREVARVSEPLAVDGGKTLTVNTRLSVPSPRLWDVGKGELYSVESRIVDGDRVLSANNVNTGFRTLAFDASKGFAINGRPLKINGVCLHHDAGALGAVVNRRAIERQLEIMQEMGVNAVRCSHNPPAPELLDLCDRMGIMVMDETFDMWRKRKTSHDYARYFDDWHERDLTDLVVRDRNHPSVIMWSIGNEVLEQWSDAKADTLSLEQANMILNFGHSADMLAADGAEMSVNSLLTAKLAGMVRDLDPSRPVTAGCNEPNPGNHLFRSGALDIIGYNYHDDWFAKVPQNFPGKPFLITESVSALATRGFYRMPSDSVIICPDRWDIPYYDESFACSAYDNCHVPWGNTHEGTMKHVRDNDFIMGQFVWTGFDYLGEPTPYGWPARSSYFGIVDLAGFPKDVYYMYQSLWRPDINVLHLFPHWDWTPGQEVDLWAYYNNADEVELFVNGESRGVSRATPDTLHASWRVRFEPGTVVAVSRKDGRVVETRELSTPGAPAAVRLTADRTAIAADGSDLAYVTAEIVDAEGRLCPNADNLITFDVRGAGRNEGVDNGSPISLERFKSDSRRAFNGKALLIVRNDGQAGPIDISAYSIGLSSRPLSIVSKR